MSLVVSPREVISNIKNELIRNIDLFDEADHYLLYGQPQQYPTYSNGKEGVIFCWPKRIPTDTIGGIKLKNSKGYVAISETYYYKNAQRTRLEKRAHVYRYVSGEAEYLCKSSDGRHDEKSIPYSFHYDQDLDYSDNDGEEDDRHPSNHLQVLHTHPRFATDEYLLADFMKMIERTCFSRDMTPYESPIYLISHT